MKAEPDYEELDAETVAILRQMTGAERLQIAWELQAIYRRDLTAHLAKLHPEWSPDQLTREVAQRFLTSEDGPREPGVPIPLARPLIHAWAHARKGLGAEAMLDFARQFREEPRSTDSWMTEFRDGES